MSLFYPSLENILEAAKRIKKYKNSVPLQHNVTLSKQHFANVSIWRGDQDIVRSYKWRGAINALLSYKYKSVVTCSAGNHAQGVAFSCKQLGISGEIFMPITTTKQKIERVKHIGGDNIKIFLEGSNFDDSFAYAKEYVKNGKKKFIHPFDDEKVIEGQASVGVDILKQTKEPIDYLFVPIGGGGLSAGISAYMKYMSPKTKIIGVEPRGAPSMCISMKMNRVVTLDTIDTFVDGAAVKRVGDITFPICVQNLDDIILIEEGHICSKIIHMYNQHGIIIEPAGALSLCALDVYNNIRGRNVVSVISGGNSDINRIPDILTRSLKYVSTNRETL
jgi:threonine dehydratase